MRKLTEQTAEYIFYVTLGLFVVYVGALAFVGRVSARQWDNYYWADMSLLWWGDSTAINNLVSGAMTQVQNSAAEWDASNTGANIDWAETSTQGSSDVDVVTVDFDVTGWGNIPGKTSLGTNGWVIIAAAVYLNSDPYSDGGFQWNTNGTMNQANRDADVRTVTVHEMGHSLALDDDDNPSTKVMNPNWQTKWYVTTNDKNDLKAIYGP